MIEFNALYPLFVVDDLERQANFYRDLFGFEAVFFVADFYLHLKHPANGVELGFLKPGHPSQPGFLQGAAAGDGQVVTFEVADARAALRQAEARGLDTALPYREEPWGQRHFILRDPAGLLLDIVESVNPEPA